MSMMYRPGKLTTEELHEVKHLMGGIVSLLSLWALLSLDLHAGFFILVTGSAIVFSLIFPVRVSRIPPSIMRWAVPVLVLVIGADFLLHLPEFIPSLVRMIVLLLLYRNFAPRTQREDLQLILLCLFCLVISGVMTVSLLFAVQILLFTPMAMALLFVICLLDRGKETEPYRITWSQFSWFRLIRRVWHVLDWKVLSLGAGLFTFVVFISTLLFVLTPRFNLEQAIPFMRMEAKPMTGFSEEVALGEVSSVQNDNTVAVQIDVPSIEKFNSTTYWRMLVLDRYTNGLFRMSASLQSESFVERMTVRELIADEFPYKLRDGEKWTIYMEGGVSRFLPIAGEVALMRFQVPQEVELIKEPRIYGLDSVSQSVFSYQLEDMQFSNRVPVGNREWMALKNAELTRELESPKYPLTTLELALKDDEISRLAAVNEAILGGRQMEVEEYSKELTKWLWEKFDYSLSPDGLVNGDDGPDPVVNWLDSGSRGHCELFASAFVLIARQAGYPARLVVGFAGGSWNSVEDYFVLRNRDAHAWVEIYDRGSKDWLRVDPTPGAGSSDPEATMMGSLRFETGWDAWVDSLRIQWYRRIVNFEQQDQIELATSLKDMLEAFSKRFSARMKQSFADFKEWISNPFSAGLFVRGLVALIVIVAFYVLWRVRYTILGFFFRFKKNKRALHPIRRRAGRMIKRLREIHGDQAEIPVLKDLEEIRFGPDKHLDRSGEVFERARKAKREKWPEK